MHVILGIRDSGTNQILHLPVVPRETEFHPVQALGRLRNHVEENDHLRRKYCLAFTADCHFLAGFCLAPLAWTSCPSRARRCISWFKQPGERITSECVLIECPGSAGLCGMAKFPQHPLDTFTLPKHNWSPQNSCIMSFDSFTSIGLQDSFSRSCQPTINGPWTSGDDTVEFWTPLFKLKDYHVKPLVLQVEMFQPIWQLSLMAWKGGLLKVHVLRTQAKHRIKHMLTPLVVLERKPRLTNNLIPPVG